MKVQRLRSTLLIALCSVVLVATQLSGYASAATKKTNSAPNYATNNANSLRISPVRTEKTISIGTSDTVSVFVQNMTDAPIVLKPIENDFIAGDEKGTPSLILDEDKYAPTHSLKRYMVPLENFTIGPKENKKIDVTIRIPDSAQSGGYFGAIRFAPVTVRADGSTAVGVAASISSLILITVPGDLVQNLALTNFDVQQNGGTATNFRTPDDLQLFLRFKNLGNVQLSPFGQIYVKQGDRVVYKVNFNNEDPKDNILPDSARRWEVPLKGMGHFGKYTVGGTFSYGTTGKNIEITKTIWIVPTAYIVGFLGAIVAIVLIVLGIRKFLKSYKQRILNNSRGGRSYRR